MSASESITTLSNISECPEIEVIIVGCGFAGLACAIESRRKGHSVILLERRLSLESLGDAISFAPNTGRIFERWGLGEKLMAICSQHSHMNLHAHSGEIINVQPLPQKLFGFNSYNGRRGEIHEILLGYAKETGVDIRFGQSVEDYWEDDEKGKAGVIVNGEKIEGDIIVGADGVRSRAREIVLGYEDRPRPSGFAIYRAWFNAKEHGFDTDPLTSFLCRDGGEFHGWIGENVHFLAMAFHGGQEICWLLTHKDDNDIGESWSFPGKISDAVLFVEGWDPRCKAIIEKATTCVDWKLVTRPPLPTWVSDGGRIVVIGDAAHPFLPTAIQGASQSVEDGVALAVSLKLAGKNDIPLATRTFEHIRYDRVRRAQEVGEETRDKLHSNPEERGRDDVKLPFPEWLLNFDVEEHAMGAYNEVSTAIQENGYTKPSVRLLMRVKDS